jgi:ribosome-binding factor A
MAVKGLRGERVAEEVRQVLCEVLISRAEDQRLRMVLVSRVELSRDLTHARVFISVLGEEKAQEASLRAMGRAQSFLRGELARRLKLRRVPELVFRLDPGIRASARLQEILQELGFSETAEGPGPEEPEAGE